MASLDDSHSPKPKRSRLVGLVGDKDDKEEQLPPPPDPNHEEPGSDNNGGKTVDDDDKTEVESKLAEALAKRCKVMTNPIVLKRIADRLPAQDLLGLRETCPGWNSTFIPQLTNKHSPIKLDFNLDKDKAVRKFTEVMKSSAQIPFSNYSLVNCRKDLLDFGSVVGPTVKKLSIRWFWKEYWVSSKVRQLIFEQMPQLTDLKFWFAGSGNWEPPPEELTKLKQFPTTLSLSSKLPNLKRFKFDFSTDQLAGSCQLVSEVIHSATELEELQLPGPEHYLEEDSYLDFLDPVLRHMWNTNNNIHKLKHLEIGNVNPPILESLLGMVRENKNALRLETFSMSVTGDGWYPPDEDVQDDDDYHEKMAREARYFGQRPEMWQKVKSFLEKQAATMRKLSIWLNEEAHHDPKIIKIILPRMEQLRDLTMSDPDYTSALLGDKSLPDLQIEDGAFASTFPRLKKLRYDIDEDDDDQFIKVSHTGLTEMFFDVNIGQFLTLPAYFPSLTRLELCLNEGTSDMETSEVYASIWNSWPGLTHLKLTIWVWLGEEFNVNPDKLLTGVSGAQLAALKAELDTLITEHRRPTCEELSALAHKYKTRPGIADLSRLEEFEFEWYDAAGSGTEDWGKKLSDTAVYCGLALLGPQLRKITFAGQVAQLLSEDCLHFMKTQGETGGHIYPNAVIKFKESSL